MPFNFLLPLPGGSPYIQVQEALQLLAGEEREKKGKVSKMNNAMELNLNEMESVNGGDLLDVFKKAVIGGVTGAVTGIVVGGLIGGPPGAAAGFIAGGTAGTLGAAVYGAVTDK